MKRALLERAQHGPLGVRAGAFGENKHALPHAPHLVRGGPERFQRVGPVSPVDEDGAREGHVPAQEGHEAQARFGGDGRVGREHDAAQEHVQLGLVVADYDAGGGRLLGRGRRREEVFAAGFDFERDSCAQLHRECKGPRCQVLGESVPPDKAEEQRDEDPVDSACEEREVGD